jgi:hypothetical protein
LVVQARLTLSPCVRTVGFVVGSDQRGGHFALKGDAATLCEWLDRLVALLNTNARQGAPD